MPFRNTSVLESKPGSLYLPPPQISDNRNERPYIHHIDFTTKFCCFSQKHLSIHDLNLKHANMLIIN